MSATTDRATLVETLWPAASAQSWMRNALLAVGGSLLLTLSAKINVPFYPVPMTMQTLVVLMIGSAFGWRLGVATVLLYLAQGATGMPVFAGTPDNGIGLPYMAGPTGGYLAGFVAAAMLTGWLAERGWNRSWSLLIAAMALGHVTIFAFGVTWLSTLIGFEKAWLLGVSPFYLATIFKTLLAAACIQAGWSVANLQR